MTRTCPATGRRIYRADWSVDWELPIGCWIDWAFASDGEPEIVAWNGDWDGVESWDEEDMMHTVRLHAADVRTALLEDKHD